jgi:glycosyltransferase involved in cell wall biosynthesis
MESFRFSRVVDGPSVQLMKIVFINDSIYKYACGASSAVGGAERQQWLLARALAKTGWTVTVGISDGIETGGHDFREEVEFIGIGRGRGHILSAWFQFLMKEQPAWWYWRCSSHLLGPAVAMAKTLAIRTIFSAALDPDVKPRLALFHHPHLWRLYAWGLCWVDKIFVQHRGQYTGLASKLQAKAFIIPSIAGANTVEAKFHSARENYVAWVGQFKQPKRPDLLLQIARRLPEVRFVVCGGPSQFRSPRGYSEQLIDEMRGQVNIELLGQVPPSRALRVIADAALLMSTSDTEGFPNTFLEAWSSGTPVVSLKIDPDSAICRFGLGVLTGNADRAVDEIRRLIAAPERRDEIALNARRYIAEMHSEGAVTTMFNHAVQDQAVLSHDSGETSLAR